MSRKFYWRNLAQADDVSTSVMCLYDPSLDGGQGGYRPMEAQDLYGSNPSSRLERFNVPLSLGMSGLQVVFPAVFSGVPIVTTSLVMPSGQSLLASAISDTSISGFYFSLSNTIPSTGYSINVIASL